MFDTLLESAAGTTIPPLEIPAGNYSTKTRIKPEHQTILNILFARYGTHLMTSSLSIKQNAKTIYILQVGKLDHPACFVNDPPSIPNEDSRQFCEWSSMVIPNGWRCALVHLNHVWICETRVNTNDEIEYRFLAVDAEGQEATDCPDHWKPNPSSAFDVAAKATLGDVSRENGKLLAGISYANAQQILRDYVYRIIDHPAVAVEPLKPLIAAWLANQNVYRLSCEMIAARRAARKEEELFQAILDGLCNIDDDNLMNTQISPPLIFSSSSSAAAPIKKPRTNSTQQGLAAEDRTSEDSLEDNEEYEENEESYEYLDFTPR